ncbi:MAG: hypothetical protein EOP11_06095 [Proteobacteria bacterium]|nr:MAG: hypothetical protein EOP11_06095 [Pseudomonadota bacterium]
MLHLLYVLLYLPLAFADCEKDFRRLNPVPSEGLLALESETKRMADSAHSSLHELDIRNGRGYVRIGVLLQGDIAYAQALSAAVREGSIAEIDAGKVVGAKVLPMLTRIAASGPKGANIVVYGNLTPRSIMESVELFRHEAPGSPEFLSEGSIRLFHNAVEKLKILEACAEHWNVSKLELCGPLKFRIDSGRPAGVIWERGE